MSLPTTPTNLTILSSNGSLVCTWDANPAGEVVTLYTLTVGLTHYLITAPNHAQTVTGLTNGTPYHVRLSATNASGTSPEISVNATPNKNPVVEQIRQNFLTVLQTVTVANGYTGDLKPVNLQRHGNSALDLAAIVEQGDEEVLGESDERGAVQRDTYIQTYLVFVFIQNPDNSQLSDDQRNNRAIADVRKAVMADLTRNNLAQWTQLEKSSLFCNEAGEVSGVVVPFRVLFRTKMYDPYTSA